MELVLREMWSCCFWPAALVSGGPRAPASQLGDSSWVPPLPFSPHCSQGRCVRAEQAAGGAA